MKSTFSSIGTNLNFREIGFSPSVARRGIPVPRKAEALTKMHKKAIVRNIFVIFSVKECAVIMKIMWVGEKMC